MKKIGLACGITLACLYMNAQTKFPFDHTVLMDGKKQTLEAYRGKPLIVELFSSTCIICFQQMPKLQAFQDRYQGKLNFILLGDDTSRLPKTFDLFRRKLKLSMKAAFDLSLFRHFSPPYVPRLVWVDTNGVIKAYSDIHDLDTIEVDRFLASNQVREVQKVKKQKFADTSLLVGSKAFSRSVFMPPIDSLDAFYPPRLQLAKSWPVFQVINARAIHLYRYAFFGTHTIWFGDSLYGKAWPDPIIESGGQDSAAWFHKRYCYSVSFPEHRTTEQLQKAMQSDLENQFGYVAKVESRMMPYYALRLVNPEDSALRSRHEKKQLSATYSQMDFKNVKVYNVLRNISSTLQLSEPLIDETGITYPIDLSFEANMLDVEDIKRAFHKKGLQLVTRYRLMQVIMLRPPLKTVAADAGCNR